MRTKKEAIGRLLKVASNQMSREFDNFAAQLDLTGQQMSILDFLGNQSEEDSGKEISQTMIEKPHSFFTACNVTTQIVAQVASNQYGGQSFTLSHLAPFVDISRQKIKKEVIEKRKLTGESMNDEIISQETLPEGIYDNSTN